MEVLLTQSRIKIIINHGHVGGGGGLVLGLLGFRFLKSIGHLKSFCVILGGWVFIKSEKGNKGGVFVVWCWGCFGVILFMKTLAKTLFSIGHMGCSIKKGN
jgi:hypothetical protein